MSRDTKSCRRVYEGAMKASTDALMAADSEIARLRSKLALAEGVVEAAPDGHACGAGAKPQACALCRALGRLKKARP